MFDRARARTKGKLRLKSFVCRRDAASIFTYIVVAIIVHTHTLRYMVVLFKFVDLFQVKVMKSELKHA